MNIYQLLEEILEELADGRQEGESITDYKKRKADELEKHFANKEEEAKTKARAYSHQYKKEKKEWKNNHTNKLRAGTQGRVQKKPLKIQVSPQKNKYYITYIWNLKK